MNSLQKKPQSEMISSIEDIIKCYICLCKINDACMCPYCQKLTCQRCLQKWLREKKNQCPHCRMSLKESQVIKVSFMNEVASYIEKINTTKKNEKSEICKKHNIQFLYYCINCKSPLCSDCYMFENEHKTHSIKKISEIYQNHLQDVKKEKYYLEHKCLLLGQNLSDLNEKLSEIGTFKYKKTKELNEMYKNLTEKLENNIETINKKLQAFREKISDRLVYLEASSKKINKEINESSQSELIKKSENIIFQIKKINEESNDDEKLYKQISLNLSTEVPNEIIPQYESSYFEVPDYKSMMEKDKNDIIFSPEMRINGLIWRIKLYPLGNNSARGEYISIFLELTDGLNDKSVYYYKIELINFQRKKNFAQEYSSEFANGESWGYSKFFKLDRLEKEGFIDSKGKIAVKIYIRPGSYEILVRDLRNYIGFLEEKVDSKNESKESSDEDEDNSNCYKSFSIKFDKLKITEGFIIDDKEKKGEKGESFIQQKKADTNMNTNKLDKGVIISVKEKEKEKKMYEKEQISQSGKKENTNSFNDFKLLSQNSLPLPEGMKIKDNIASAKKEKKETNEKEKDKENEINKIRPFSKKNPFLVDLSDDNDNYIPEQIKEFKENFDIPSKRNNSPMVSDDSYDDIMDSLKVMDDLKPQGSSNNNKNLLDYKNNNLLNDFLNLNSGSNSTNNNANSGNNNNLFSYNNNFGQGRYFPNNYFNPFHFNSSSSVNNINSSVKNYIGDTSYKSKYNFNK